MGNISVKASEIPNEQKIFTDMWNLYKMFYRVEDSDDYWDEFIYQVNELSKEHNNSVLAVQLGIAIIEDRYQALKKIKENKI